MLKSMTGYGSATINSSFGRLFIELNSVNRKHLEVHLVHLPEECLCYESEIKKWIGESVTRGMVNLRMRVFYDKESPLTVTPNLPLARQIKSAFSILAEDLSINLNDEALLSILLRNEGLMLFDKKNQDSEAFRQVLKEVIEKALEDLISMKVMEGHTLYLDMCERLNLVEKHLQIIESKVEGATDRYREKLKKCLLDVCGVSVENEERLLREVCLYADKIDITEEIVRFKSHLDQMRVMIKGEETSVGKALEFVVQELNREINTIGAKSSDVEISRSVIIIKTELERIREQIQNIE